MPPFKLRLFFTTQSRMSAPAELRIDMLNKMICYCCKKRMRHLLTNLGTDEDFKVCFENEWDAGWVNCPRFAKTFYTRGITSEIGKGCPYELEHIVTK